MPDPHTPTTAAKVMTTRILWLDSAFAALVILGTSALFLNDLGFYTDDWHNLAAMASVNEGSFVDVARTVAYWDRPGHAVVLATLYTAFGSAPLPYHVINTGVLAVMIVLFYLILVQLGVTRLTALSVALIYGLLPHYSTTRFWMNMVSYHLSMALCFLSVLADLKAIETRTAARWSWKLLSVLGILASLLTVEIALPLFAASLLLMWYRARQLSPNAGIGLRGDVVPLMAVNVVTLGAVLAYKLQVNSRPLVESEPFSHLARVLKGAIGTNFGHHGFGVGFPVATAKVLWNYSDTAMLLGALTLGATVGLYLWRIARHSGGAPQPWPIKTLGIGFGLFLVGYGMAFVTPDIGFQSTGLVNRTAIAAAIGTAVCAWTAVTWTSALLPRRFYTASVCVLVAMFSASGFLILNGLARFWTTASRQQTTLLSEIREIVPTLPPHSTVLLDGACPYVGTAPVFECHWDASGALRLLYGDNTLRADVVTRRLTIRNVGLVTYIYKPDGEISFEPDFTTHCCPAYRYGERLFVYHAQQRRLHHLPSRQSALAYFRQTSPDFATRCPGQEGIGAPVLW